MRALVCTSVMALAAGTLSPVLERHSVLSSTQLTAPNKSTDVLERGGVITGAYTNRFFGFRLPVPQGWNVLTEEEMLSGSPSMAPWLKQIRAGVALSSLPMVPLMVMENSDSLESGKAAVLLAMAIRLRPEDHALPSVALADGAQQQMEREVPGQRISRGHDELGGKMIPYADGKGAGGMRHRHWVFTMRGYGIVLMGTYEQEAGLAELRKAMQGLVLDATPK